MCITGRCSWCQHGAVEAGVNHHDLIAVQELNKGSPLPNREDELVKSTLTRGDLKKLTEAAHDGYLGLHLRNDYRDAVSQMLPVLWEATNA